MSSLIELSRIAGNRTVSLKWVGMILLAIIELLIVSIRFDSGVLVGGQGITRFLSERLPLIPQFAAVILAATLVFGARELMECLSKAGRSSRHGVSVPLLVIAHLLIFALFFVSSVYYFDVNRGTSAAVFLIWSVTAFAAVVSWFAVLVDPSVWFAIFRELSGPILLGSCVGVLAWAAGQWALQVWELLSFATFEMIRLILTLAFLEVYQDTSTLSIGTTNFVVTIAPECSGYEGMGLAVVFITTYLWWNRKEHLFPGSLLLIPASVCLMFLVNAIRISALILIGHLGAQDIALGGFHSQAGWIGFNLVALGLVTFARTSSLFVAAGVHVSNTSSSPQSENRSVPMLAPFVFLTLSIMLLGIVQSGFDWLYPIRLLVVAVVIAFFFRRYPKEFWKLSFHWPAIALGVSVYLIWIFLEKDDGGIAKNLYETSRSLSPGLFTVWLGFRILGSVITVPIAEEFAFRGYLIPWLTGERSKRWSWAALIVSSIAFGVLHPGRWIAGTIAGGLYGIAFCQRGKVMDAVLAHATTNVLIAAEAILLSQWSLWG